MDLVGVVGIREPEQLVVRLVEARSGPEEPEPRANPVDVRVDRDVRAAEREEQHARGRLAPDARQLAEPRACLLERLGLQRAEVVVAGRIASSTAVTRASRTAAQSAKRSRRRAYATSRLRSFVFCESTVRMSSSTGARCGRGVGRPYSARRRSRIARRRRGVAGF